MCIWSFYRNLSQYEKSLHYILLSNTMNFTCMPTQIPTFLYFPYKSCMYAKPHVFVVLWAWRAACREVINIPAEPFVPLHPPVYSTLLSTRPLYPPIQVIFHDRPDPLASLTLTSIRPSVHTAPSVKLYHSLNYSVHLVLTLAWTFHRSKPPSVPVLFFTQTWAKIR